MISQSKNIVLILAVLLIVGCATSVKTKDHQFVENEKTVYISHHYKGDEALYIDQIVAILEKHNFEITRIDPHANYDLVWGYSGSNAELSLRQGRDIIIQVDAHRYIADVIPTRHEAADRSINRFDEALGQMLND